jgi:autotransporter passenger strand-loop-strand repeat protein
LFVSSGATASAAKVLKGAEIVYAGGTITSAAISGGGGEAIAAGTKVTGLTVGSGVALSVLAGATASSTVLSGGTEIVSSGGVIGGAVTFGTNARLSIGAAANIAVTVSGFTATDTLDLASFKFSTVGKPTFVVDKAKNGGTLTITDGGLTATVTLFGQYVAAGFHLAKDAATGTAITYAQPAAQAFELAIRKI